MHQNPWRSISEPLILLALLAGAVVSAPAALAQPDCSEPVWADEFDAAALDTTKWSYQLGDGCPDLCGWGNNELEYYQEDNVEVSGGLLRIAAREEQVGGRRYTSARIRTLGQGDWTFGRFEARIRLSEGQGIWPAFWMLPTDEVYGTWPQSGEIDVMENVGHEPAVVYGTMHYGDPWPNNSFQSAAFELNEGKFSDGFHTFALEREPGVIRWLVDDLLYAQRTVADVGEHTWPFDERFHFILNVAVGGDWPGGPDESTVFPQHLEVDYVRVYDRGRPYLEANQRVLKGELGAVFELANPEPGSKVQWQVPAGVRVVSGSKGRRLVVDWGARPGTVAVEVTSACASARYAVDVAVDLPEVSLEMPNQLALQVLSPSRVLATWNDRSSEERSFELIAKGSRGWQKIADAGTDATQAVSSALSPGTQYDVRVRARNAARVSPWSPQRRITLPEELPRPGALSATVASPTSVRLTWVDKSSDEEGFEIDLRLVPEAWTPGVVTDANAQSAVLDGLSPGGTYMFRLRARREGGLSEWRRARINLPGG